MPCVLPVITPASKSKVEIELDHDDDECDREYLDVQSKKFIKKYNQLLSMCNRLDRTAGYYRKRMWHHKNKLDDISELCTSRPSSPDSD